MVAVDRRRHTLVDLDVSSSLRGDLAVAHTAGDDRRVLAADTREDTVFAFGRDVVHSAADGPHGLIGGTVLRDDVPPAGVAWPGTLGSC